MKSLRNLIIAAITINLYCFAINFTLAEEIQQTVKENQPQEIVSEVLLNLEEEPQVYSLNLEESLNLAMDNNNQFNIQKEETKIYKIKAQKSALSFLPHLSATMSLDYQSNIAKIGEDDTIRIPGIGPISLAGFMYDDHWKRYNAVSATQPVTGMYRLYHWRRIASLSFEKALLEEELAGEKLALNVYYYYFKVLLSKYQLEAYQKNVHELETYQKIAQARFDEGSSIKRDVQKIQVELDSSRYNVFVKENEYKNSLNRLKNILGIPQNSILEINQSFENLSNTLPEEEAIRQAIENNQKIKQLELDVKIATHAKKEQFGRYIPEVNVSTTYFNQSGMDYMAKNDFLLSINMEFNFFDWGKRELSIKQKQHEINQASLNLKDYLENIEIEIKEKYSKVQEAKMLTDVSENAVRLAEKNVEISSLRYKNGLQIIADVLSDQSQLSKARADYYQALFNEQAAIAELKQAMGILVSAH
jgi:outer membrane protein TolC